MGGSGMNEANTAPCYPTWLACVAVLRAMLVGIQPRPPLQNQNGRKGGHKSNEFSCLCGSEDC